MNKVDWDIYNEILKKQLVAKEVLDETVLGSSRDKIKFISFLREKKIIPEETLLSLLSGIMNVPFVNLNETPITSDAVRAVPVRVAWHYEFMPISVEDNKVTLAVNVPLSIRSQDEIRLSLGSDISLVLAKKDHIFNMLKTYYGIASDTVDRMVGYTGAGYNLDDTFDVHKGIEDIDKLAEDASVTKLVNQIILEAYNKRATDIHIEPSRGRVMLRYRIDGKLHLQTVSDDFSRFVAPILSRIKIMTNLNIVERRVPQDGRAIVRIQNQVLDLRVSFMPTPHGESVVIRILPSKRHWDLEKLGIMADDAEKFGALLKNTSGIIFVTGPTGSGKTTTLYSCIEKINKKDIKILTIEDPVEYEIENVVQIQVNPEVGLTFARGLRSMLRQDPDVMMVGEVRDNETAEIAIRVALTGHLVLSTLHTNDAVTGVTRLVDIGIPPYLIVSTIKAFIAQRLIRVICPDCKVKDPESTEKNKDFIAKALNILPEDVVIYKGTGCEKCNHAGYYGRMAIYEIFILSNEIGRMITEKRSASEIKKFAVKNGMRPLIKSGWVKVVGGITTFEEVLRVCQDTNIVEENEDSLPGEIQGKTDVKTSAQTTGKPQAMGKQSAADNEKRSYPRMSGGFTINFSLVQKARAMWSRSMKTFRSPAVRTFFSEAQAR
ncbi:MAG: type II/IV secretion system protein [Candidatus Omnitrophica bacterium]|nr:type II/IV secretion system protein [Candidatus Omnitrophota bacterium]